MEPGNDNVRFLDCYRVTERLGDQPFEETMLAVDEHREKPVLVRVLKGPVIRTARALAAWRSSLRKASSARHPSLAAVLDAGATEAGQPWFVVEIASGETLRSRLEWTGRGLEPEEAYRLAMDLASALATLHSAAGTHGDIRPANLVLPASEEAPLLLLGAGVRASLRQTFDTDRYWTGDLRYFATAEAGAALNERTDDVYAFGLVVFEMTTGRPWQESPGQAPACTEEADELRAWLRMQWPELPVWAVRLLPRCLHADPALRYPDGRALEAAVLAAASDSEAAIPVVAETPLPTLPVVTAGSLVPVSSMSLDPIVPFDETLPALAPSLPAVSHAALPPELSKTDRFTPGPILDYAWIAILGSPAALLYAWLASRTLAQMFLIFCVVDGLVLLCGTLILKSMGDAVDMLQGIGVRATTVWTQIDNKTEGILQIRLLSEGAKVPDIVSLRPGTREILSVDPGTSVSVVADGTDVPLYETRIESPKEIEIHPDRAMVRDGEEA